MLDEFLKRGDVETFIKEIKTNEKYFAKRNESFPSRSFTVSSELALYIFYDALYKYRVILNDIYLFDEYLEQLELLFRKLDNFEDVMIGINKLICKMVIVKLDIKDIESKEARKQILSYIHGHYIINGYFIHGFNSSYSSTIEKDGFSPEEYENYYERFQKINEIFAKYNVIRIVDKDFTKKRVYFTDDTIMGCYYSTYAPMFYYSFLTSEDYFGKLGRQDGYLIDNYDVVISRLKRFMSNNLFSKSEQRTVLKTIDEEWNILNRSPRKVALLFVKRSKVVGSSNDKLRDYLESDKDLEEIVDRIFSSKYGDVVIDKMIRYGDYQLLLLDDFYQQNSVEKEDKSVPVAKRSFQLANSYGMASILLILGSFCITLGVIFTIIMILRGM